MKTRSGFSVEPSAGRAVISGDRAWIKLHVGPVSVREPIEIVAVASGADRCGFAYGTLEGHPVSGEEAFIVHRSPDDTIWFTLRSLTRAPHGWWRVAYPASPGRAALLPPSLPERSAPIGPGRGLSGDVGGHLDSVGTTAAHEGHGRRTKDEAAHRFHIVEVVTPSIILSDGSRFGARLEVQRHRQLPHVVVIGACDGDELSSDVELERRSLSPLIGAPLVQEHVPTVVELDVVESAPQRYHASTSSTASSAVRSTTCAPAADGKASKAARAFSTRTSPILADAASGYCTTSIVCGERAVRR